LLGRLREGVKSSRKDPARHQELAGPFRGALGEHRRLDLEKTLGVEIIAGHLGNLVADGKVAQHSRPPQVEITILETQVLGHRLAIQGKWQYFRLVQNAQRLRNNFDVPGGELRVFCSREPGDDFSRDLDDVLAAKAVGERSNLRMLFGPKDNLGDPVAIAKVYENDAAVVAARIDPAAKGDARSGVRFA
jgi:hypothetical protein